jgi:CARDB
VDDAGTPTTGTTLDMRNNLVWAWGSGFGTLVYKGARGNIVANLYSDPGGPLGSQENALTVCSGDCVGAPTTDGRAYVDENVSGTPLPSDLNDQGTEAAPFAAPALATQISACRLVARTLPEVGARPLDAHDVQALATIAQPSTCQLDLRVDSFTGPASAVIGVPFSVTDVTANVGLGSAEATVTKFYISTRTTLDAGAVAIGSRSVPAMASGETSTATTTVTIPNGVGAACDYHILAVANATGVGDESATANNVRSQPIKVCPDLLVDSLTAPAAATPSTAIDVVDTVRKRGQGGAGAWTLKFYLSTLPTFDAPPSSWAAARCPPSTGEPPVAARRPSRSRPRRGRPRGASTTS